MVETRWPAVALVILLLSGCSAAPSENQPPQLLLLVDVTSGEVPLNVTFEQRIYDAEGDELVVVFDNDGLITDVTLDKRSPPTNTTKIKTITFNSPGPRNITVTVSDGIHTVRESVIIEVTGEPFVPTDLKVDSNLTAACPACSGGKLSGITTPGGEACAGFRDRRNGTDCVWYPLPSEWEGKVFFANATAGADADVQMRTGCEIGSTVVQNYIGDDYERYDIPFGARCAVIWSVDKAPVTIRFEVYTYT